MKVKEDMNFDEFRQYLDSRYKLELEKAYNVYIKLEQDCSDKWKISCIKPDSSEYKAKTLYRLEELELWSNEQQKILDDYCKKYDEIFNDFHIYIDEFDDELKLKKDMRDKIDKKIMKLSNKIYQAMSEIEVIVSAGNNLMRRRDAIDFIEDGEEFIKISNSMRFLTNLIWDYNKDVTKLGDKLTNLKNKYFKLYDESSDLIRKKDEKEYLAEQKALKKYEQYSLHLRKFLKHRLS